MGMWDWLLGRVSARSDAAPALPGPAPLGRLLLEDREDALYNPLTGLGGQLDKGAAARPSVFWCPLSDPELEAGYSSGGLFRRIVDLLPDEACRKGWSVPEIDAVTESRLGIYESTTDAGKMSRLYGDAIVLMVTQDDIPPAFRSRPDQWLAQPLIPERVGSLQSLPVFDAWDARPLRWQRDVRQPGYRLPELWQISTDGFYAQVHASRVLLFRGAKRTPSRIRTGRTNGLPDDSILQAVFDEIARLTATAQGGAVLAEELSIGVLKIGELAQKTTGDQASTFRTYLQRFQQALSVLNMAVLGPNDSYDKKATPATGFKDLSEGAQSMLATVLGWPRSMLSGEPPGGLSTDNEGGRESERRVISGYQEQRLRRPLEQFYTVLYASQDGPTKGQTPDEWALTFAPLDEPTAQQVAELRKTIAETDQINITAGVYTAADVTRSRFGAEGYSSDLDPVTVPEATVFEAALHARGGLATIPALISAGVIEPATAADLLGLPPPPEPDPAEEAAIAAAQAHLAAGGANPPPADPASEPAPGAPPGHTSVRAHIRKLRQQIATLQQDGIRLDDYEIEHQGSAYVVVKKATGKAVPGGSHPTKAKAEAHMAALYAAMAHGDAAADSVVVLIPAADPGLRAAVEAAIGQRLTVEEDPHVTVLYVGTGLAPDAVQEVVEEVGEAVEALDPGPMLAWPTLRAFPPGPDGTPIVLEFSDAYAVAGLNATLLRALAHRISARQFPTFRAHLTVGYASAPLTPEAEAALLDVPLVPDGTAPGGPRVPVGEVQVRVGDRVVLRARPGVEAPANEPNVPMEAK
jgi:phage-related protein (TIGR01555 family)